MIDCVGLVVARNSNGRRVHSIKNRDRVCRCLPDDCAFPAGNASICHVLASDDTKKPVPRRRETIGISIKARNDASAVRECASP